MAAQLQPPVSFPFPFTPYEIQHDFMTHLYKTLEAGKIGIFESPTGTVRSINQYNDLAQIYVLRNVLCVGKITKFNMWLTEVVG